MIILGIETSCDETSAAVVCSGGEVLSNVVYSQAALHGPYGGVVPEIACRSHVETLPGILADAVEEAGTSWHDIDAVAVTYGPGLASSLLVGIAAAKGLALRLDKPLYAVNHLHAHMYSAFLAENVPALDDACPFLSLVVSGGHTCLVRVDALGKHTLLGQTIDDAAGEAFDKGANLLNLGYPGGPAIDREANGGDPAFVNFPRGRLRKGKAPHGNLDADLCFSFSGLKTALLYYLRDHGVPEDAARISDIAASYQEAVVDALVSRCARALGNMQILAAGGGVTLNSRLRAALASLAAERGITLMLAPPRYCGDNAAMIAAQAAMGQGITGQAAMEIDAEPNLPVAT